MVRDYAETFGVPVYLDNDANMAGLAEWQYGAGKGHMMTLSTSRSVPASAEVSSRNGHLLQGFRGMGAELGHMTDRPRWSALRVWTSWTY